MSKDLKSVLLIDGAQWYKAYFQAVFPASLQWQIHTDVKTTASVTVIVYSFFGHDIGTAKQRWPKAYTIFIAGEPNHVTYKGPKPTPNLILDCKDVPSRRWTSSKFLYLPFFALHFVERNTCTPASLLQRPTLVSSSSSSSLQNSMSPAMLSSQINIDDVIKQKTKFCAFMYHHDVAHRNALFHNISKLVEPVDPLGRCCHPQSNTLKTDRRQYEPGRVTFYDTAVEKYRKYKFVICCENEVGLKGYVTEKIINAYLAHAIPIYRGAPDVASMFNPKSFINGNDLTDAQLAAEVQRIHQNDAVYRQMLMEPVFAISALPKWFDFTLDAQIIQHEIQHYFASFTEIRIDKQKRKPAIVKRQQKFPGSLGLVRYR